MSRTQYTLINDGDGREFLTVVMPGRAPLLASNEHPNWLGIRSALDDALYLDDPEGFADLFDVAEAVARKFTRLSERVAVNSGRVYFDGDVVDDSVTRQIVRFLDEGVDEWEPLVNFMEHVAANPVEHSREQLYTWLNAREFSLTPEGYIVAYKGVAQGDEDGLFFSLHAGPAIVNGDEHIDGQVPQRVGDTVELPRSDVVHDPSAACHFGLHVGTFSYAQSYARGGAFLKVAVNPRDVVSVPTSDAGDKVRVCRYEILDAIEPTPDNEVTSALDAPDQRPECLICSRPQGEGEGECAVGPFETDD